MDSHAARQAEPATFDRLRHLREDREVTEEELTMGFGSGVIAALRDKVFHDPVKCQNVGALIDLKNSIRYT
jgi:hypothetical protein